MVLNLSEIETKVREATNDDAWLVNSHVKLNKLERKGTQ